MYKKHPRCRTRGSGPLSHSSAYYPNQKNRKKKQVATCSSLVQLPRPTSSSSSSTRNQTRPSVKSLNATLEMDVTPSYSSVWRGRDGNAGGWRPGRSRLNVSSLIKVSGGQDASAASPLRVSARLHPLPCLPAGTALFGPLAYSASTAYRHNSEGTEADAPDGQPAEILGLKVMSKKKNANADGGNAVASSSSSSQVAGSATFPFLVDYDSAGSVVLYADDDGATGSGVEDGGPPSSSSTSSVPLACCNLSPPPPDFPEEWSAVIEANVRDKGYTMVVRQLYSASNKKVRLDVHSLGEFFFLGFGFCWVFRGVLEADRGRSRSQFFFSLAARAFSLLSRSLDLARSISLYFSFLFSLSPFFSFLSPIRLRRTRRGSLERDRKGRTRE